MDIMGNMDKMVRMVGIIHYGPFTILELKGTLDNGLLIGYTLRYE